MKKLQSKLSPTYHYLSDVSNYLTGNYEGVDPIFLGRLAYVAKVCKTKFKITEGYRSTERQKELYEEYKSGKLKSAARPGTSWHEFRLAVDTSTSPIRGWSNSDLKVYGLCKPILSEGWHIQPIETMGLSGDGNRKKWQPLEVEDMTKDETLALIKSENNGKETKVSSWAKDSWCKAVAKGVVDGSCPGGQLTREQFAVILDRLNLLQ